MLHEKQAKRILIVEDESIIAMEIKSRLRALGYQPLAIVDTGREAVEQAGKLQPDLVMMDISLKGEMDGVEAAKKIRSKHRIPVIYLTANTDATTFQRAKITEPFGYLLKPLEERLLHSTIEMALYKAKIDEELDNYREHLEDMVRERTDDLITSNQRLQESEENYRTIFNSANDAIFIHAAQTGQIIDVNAKMTEMFKCSREEALASSIESLSANIPPFTNIEAMQYMSLAAEGKPQIFEWLSRDKAGKTFWSEISLKASVIGGKKRLLAVVRDIEQRKKVEFALVKAKEGAEEASRAKSEFLNNMGHELRTPLNHILGMTDLTLDSELTDDQRHFLEVVKLSGKALLHMLNNLLDIAKIESGKLKLQNNPFIPQELIGNSTHLFAAQANKKGLEFSGRTTSEVPKILIGDVARLQQILSALIDNAIKFTQAGHVKMELAKVEEGRSEAELHFTVSDTGIGIPPEKQESIFQLFSQADSSPTRAYGGGGLGLTIAKKLIKKMGGKIWVESQENKGSTFHFTVRLQKETS